jgi:hypothetical protein
MTAPAFTSAIDEGDFEPRAPSPEIAATDQKYCDDLHCGTCGLHGLEYSPWYNPVKWIYTAWACCPVCGDLEQIQTPITC